jgi:homogentisate 1,2-dioxygenase
MPFYYRLGEVPHKRHTQFRRPDGELYTEHLMGTEGFAGRSSLLYHHHPPTAAVRVEERPWAPVRLLPNHPLRHRHFRTFGLEAEGDPITGRRVLLGNRDCTIAVCRPAEPMTYFYRNGAADELLFVHAGTGRLESLYGVIRYRAGDYLVIPFSTTYRLVPETESRFLVVESYGSIETPRRYRNEFGQLLEHSPFRERDIRPPEALETHIEAGEFEVRVKMRDGMTAYIFPFHPFDVVGWDGYLYPYAFHILDFEPITGRVHMPPPTHQTFQGPNFVVCSFVPRLYDYHPQAIPAPYVHSNVNSDEVLYYVDGNFMSRKGIEQGSITLHPGGIPHGPHPGTVEASLGKQETRELAVMIDTFHPLLVAEGLKAIEDDGYPLSWRLA